MMDGLFNPDQVHYLPHNSDTDKSGREDLKTLWMK